MSRPARKRREVEDPNNTWDMQLMVAVMKKDTAEAANLLEKGAKINHVADAQGRSVTPFLACALKGDIPTLKWIVDSGGDPAGRLDNGATILHHCIMADNAELLETLCSGASEIGAQFDLCMLDAQKLSATQLAINLHKPELARILLRNGAAHPFHALVDAAHNQTARACRVGDVATLETMLLAGDNHLQRDSNGQTLLHIGLAHLPIVDLLLDRGIPVNYPNRQGQSALLYTVLNTPRNFDIVEQLIQRGADLNAKDSMGLTSLMHALSSYHPELIRKLLEHKADISVGDRFGCTALHHAVSARLPQAVELLLTVEGVEPNVVDKLGRTPLHRAASGGHAATLSVLIAKEAVDCNIRDRDGFTPLHAAVAADQTECVKLLLQRVTDEFLQSQTPILEKGKKPAAGKKGKDAPQENPNARLRIDVEDNSERTALQLASELHRADAVALLVEVGKADVHRSSKHGNLVHEAVAHDDLRLVSLLLEAGADPNFRNTADIAPLLLAANRGIVEIASALLGAGATVVDQDANTLSSPLHLACTRQDTAMAEILLEAGGSQLAALTDSSVRSALHIAAASGDVGMLALLVQNGGIIEQADADGCTALQAATRANSVECYDLLVASGASLLTKDAKRWTPLHTAIACGAGNVAKRVIDALAKLPGRAAIAGIPTRVAGPSATPQPTALAAVLAMLDVNDRTPMLLAAEFGQAALGRLLIKAKAQSLTPPEEFVADEAAAAADESTNAAEIPEPVAGEEGEEILAADGDMGGQQELTSTYDHPESDAEPKVVATGVAV